ncbi:MAG: 16S rRNA (adenine(1518)-N(6)/adenine(1519)-N(6))-dimethyltransferase RsmA [Candidatus Yanofskybacteria bacterium]|nr:16S rRNA (adenine(1518)-N(6)/adenine(1519)-N(6))-dimethyltransferase RsmA [Candidatus Yanofskybacteria bacterium]
MIKAKKSLGQNFLVNQGIIQKIIDAAELKEEDTVLEIGPGTGLLTQVLVKHARTVIAVEKDASLIHILREQFKEAEIIEADVLNFIPKLPSRSYKVVGNIPYYLTSHLLRLVLEQWPTPERIIFMIQKEVAQRIMAKPPRMNLLALSVQYYSQPTVVARVSRGSFRPMPDVDSAVIKLMPRNILANPKLFNLIRAGFAQKRKILSSNLADHTGKTKEELQTILQELKIPEKSRAENLALEQWQELSKKIG